MTENPTDVAIVARVIGAYDDGPPDDVLAQLSHREIHATVARWEPWLTGQRRVEVPTERAQIVGRLLQDLRPTPRGDGVVVDVDRLRRLSHELSRGGEAHLRLWVAVMLWGGGNGDPRAPFRTASALADPRLDDVLRETADLSRGGDAALEQSIARTNLRQMGLSFTTKWLWAAALTQTDGVRPVVTDARVWSTLNQRLGWTGARAARRPGSVHRTAAAIRAINRWAPLLSQRWQRPVAPDTVEGLLFLRRDGSLYERLASESR